MGSSNPLAEPADCRRLTRLQILGTTAEYDRSS